MTSAGSKYRTRDSTANWTSLRSFGKSTFSKLTMFVPVFGYFILFNDNIVGYLKLTFEVCPADGCQVNWRIFLVYFGLCFVSVGAAIFSLRCPDIVKRYSTSREFFETSKLFYTHHHNLLWLLDDIEKMLGEPYDDGLNLKYLADSNASIGADQAHVLSGAIAAYYNFKNKSQPRYRWACLIFYGIGVTLLSIPTLLTFAEVVAVALQRFS